MSFTPSHLRGVLEAAVLALEEGGVVVGEGGVVGEGAHTVVGHGAHKAAVGQGRSALNTWVSAA